MVATAPGGTQKALIREEVKAAVEAHPHGKYQHQSSNLNLSCLEIAEQAEDDSITEMAIPQVPSIVSHQYSEEDSTKENTMYAETLKKG